MPNTAERAVEIAEGGGVAFTEQLRVRRVAGEKYDTIVSYKLGPIPEPALVEPHEVLGVIVAGHTRYMAAQRLKLDKVPVHVAKELSPQQIRAYRIADNKSAELASWDNDLLPVELSELLTDGCNLHMLGFDDDELARLLPTEVAEGLTEPHIVPEPPESPQTRPGDMYQLGRHRLLCGDSLEIPYRLRLNQWKFGIR